MPKDRYFVEIITKPQALVSVDFSLFGYFETKPELASFLEELGKRAVGAKDLHIRIHDLLEKTLIEDTHFPIGVKKEKKGAPAGEQLDWSSRASLLSYINKYFDIVDEPHPHHHYVAEVTLQHPEGDSVMLCYFGAINEFASILEHVGKKIKGEGNLNLVIE